MALLAEPWNVFATPAVTDQIDGYVIVGDTPLRQVPVRGYL